MGKYLKIINEMNKTNNRKIQEIFGDIISVCTNIKNNKRNCEDCIVDCKYRLKQKV